MPPVSDRTYRAFTLIELLVVIAIIGDSRGDFCFPFSGRLANRRVKPPACPNEKQIGSAMLMYSNGKTKSVFLRVCTEIPYRRLTGHEGPVWEASPTVRWTEIRQNLRALPNFHTRSQTFAKKKGRHVSHRAIESAELRAAQRVSRLLSGLDAGRFRFFHSYFHRQGHCGRISCSGKQGFRRGFLTLAFRPVGAALFGWLADRYGRRTPLMASVVCYSVISLLCGFAPSLAALLALAPCLESQWRRMGTGGVAGDGNGSAGIAGFALRHLQSGYNVGYLLAAVVYGLVFPRFGWRAMFFVGVIPALLSLYIRARVHESPVYEQQKRRRRGVRWRKRATCCVSMA